jgi:hypothetical protein
MTLPPERIGYKGQSYKIVVDDDECGPYVIGWTNDPNQPVAHLNTRPGWSNARVEKVSLWRFPLQNKRITTTNDSMSFVGKDFACETELPLPPHVGAFGTVRRHHVHEGVDLYALNGEPVYAVEDAVVVNIVQFTGEGVHTPWWHDTWAVMAEGAAGVVCYGEIVPLPSLVTGERLVAGQMVGHVKTVLKKDKGRPMSMLHLELYQHGTIEPISVEQHIENPGVPVKIEETPLLDPTAFLMEATT